MRGARSNADLLIAYQNSTKTAYLTYDLSKQNLVLNKKTKTAI